MALQIKTFRRYGDKERNIRDYVQDRECEKCGGFQRHRATDLQTVLRGPCGKCRNIGGASTCCNDELIQTGQVVLDPGFENIVSLTGRTALPGRSYSSDWGDQLYYDDGGPLEFFAWTPNIQWIGENGNWDVITGGAFEGSNFVRAVSGAGGPTSFLVPDQYPMCNFGSKFDLTPAYPVDVEPWLYTAMSPAGSFLEMKIRAKGSSSTMQMLVDFWHPDGSIADISSFGGNNQSLTGSWTEYTLSGFLDGTESSSYRFRAGVRAGASSTIDVDSFTVTVT